MKNLAPLSALVCALIASASPTHADKAGVPLRANAGKLSLVKAKAPAKTAVFSVSKMHCEGCASGLVQAAKHWNGVKTADVNYTQKRALVTYDPKKTNTTKITKEFARIGFPAKVVQ